MRDLKRQIKPSRSRTLENYSRLMEEGLFVFTAQNLESSISMYVRPKKMFKLAEKGGGKLVHCRMGFEIILCSGIEVITILSMK